MQKAARYMWALVAAAALYACWTFASRWLSNLPAEPAAAAPEAAAYTPDTTLKISQFYVYPPELTEGDKALLCYGVENAKDVRVEPPVGDVWPSRNRCLEVTPQRTTRYKLIAESAAGKVETSTTEVKVTADPAILPKIAFFVAGPAKQTAAEEQAGGAAVYSLCFEVRNSAEVRVDPPVIPPTSALNGCFYDNPSRTTTYTLTATDAKGRKTTRQLTIKVPGAN